MMGELGSNDANCPLLCKLAHRHSQVTRIILIDRQINAIVTTQLWSFGLQGIHGFKPLHYKCFYLYINEERALNCVLDSTVFCIACIASVSRVFSTIYQSVVASTIVFVISWGNNIRPVQAKKLNEIIRKAVLIEKVLETLGMLMERQKVDKIEKYKIMDNGKACFSSKLGQPCFNREKYKNTCFILYSQQGGWGTKWTLEKMNKPTDFCIHSYYNAQQNFTHYPNTFLLYTTILLMT